MAEIKYWCNSLRQVEGRPVNAWLMYRLAKALSLPLLPNTTVEIIQHQLQTKKQLKKLGDNQREKWLEGLVAMVQAAEMGGDAMKHLCHLLQTEEQQLHARQIRWVNQTAQPSGGLSTVSIANPDGTITNYSEKAAMETVCLAEAKARFTQSNDTPFLMEPLIAELGLLNCNKPPFDAITLGTYQPLEGTDPGARLLIKHLKWLAEVLECKLDLTKTLHSKGWKKPRNALHQACQERTLDTTNQEPSANSLT